MAGPMIITEPTRPVRTSAGLATSRRVSTLNAHNFKLQGGGSTATQTRESAVGDLGAAGGGALGGAIGGDTGRQIGELAGRIIGDLVGGDRPTKSRTTSGASTLIAGNASGDPCPGRAVRVPGLGCVDPLALPPGGDPAIVPTSGTVMGGGGNAVIGAFGVPAMQPQVVTQLRRKCGPGMVLGKDNLCYPKAMLPKRSKYRKWKGEPKPVISRADMRAIRAAARAQDRVKELAKDVGLGKYRPKKK